MSGQSAAIVTAEPQWCKLIRMLPLPPQRVTLEHEAAHAVVVRVGGGTVAHVEVNAKGNGPRISLARTKWQPPLGDGNALLAGFVAGPAQTSISVQRLDIATAYIQNSIACETDDMAQVMSQSSGKPPNIEGVGAIINQSLPVIEAYLRREEVQSAVCAIADALEKAVSSEEVRVDWSDLETLVAWESVPPLPALAS